jgi:RNA polymerase sigma factor (sigma-70 family)
LFQPRGFNVKNNSGELHILQDRRVSIYMGKRGPLTEAERNRCVVQHMDLVAPVAHKYRGGVIEWDELLAIGREGLVRAALGFDPKLGDFRPRALQFINNTILNFIRDSKTDRGPGEEDDPLPPLEGDRIEKIFNWDAWGNYGNSIAICEAWTVAGASPEDITIAYDLVKHRRDRFAAAFLSLSKVQRDLFQYCYLHDPKLTIESAAREIGISRYRASRSLQKALETMREVIKRADDNERTKFAIAASA